MGYAQETSNGWVRSSHDLHNGIAIVLSGIQFVYWGVLFCFDIEVLFCSTGLELQVLGKQVLATRHESYYHDYSYFIDEEMAAQGG